MRVTICSSSSETIDEKYKDEAVKVTEYLASNGFDLNWGSGSISIMGICYDSFCKFNRKIYGYTSSKYADDIENLPNAEHRIFDTTFDLKQNIFNDADILLMLPGGSGTISEFFSYLEEIRSNDKPRELILYNESKHFDLTLKLIDDLVSRNFNSQSIYNFFKVANNFEEFQNIIEEIKNNYSRKL